MREGPARKWKDALMQPDEYGKLIRDAAFFMDEAAHSLCYIGSGGGGDGDVGLCTRFLTRSADAGQHLAKAMLGRQSIAFAHSHDMEALAHQAGEAGFPDLARAVVALNGLTREQHDGMPTEEDSLHAVRRMHAVIDGLGEELDRAAEDPALEGQSSAWRRSVLRFTRDARDVLEESQLPLPEAPEAERASIDSLAMARAPLAEALAALEARLSLSPASGLPEPSPFC